MILVSGGSGTIGARLVKGLCERGFTVRVLVLPGDPFVGRLDGLGVEVCYGDVADRGSLAGVFDGVKTVYHLAAVVIAHDYDIYRRVNVNGTHNMLEAATAAGVGHFIHVSSASVTYPRTTPYSRSKRECERLVRQQEAMAWTLVRPTLVYEPGGGQEFMMFMDYLRRFPVVPFIGRGDCLKNPVFVEDLVQGMVALADNPRSHGQVYSLCGGEELPLKEMAELMLEAIGERRPFVHLPVPLCTAAALVLRGLLREPPLTISAIAGVTQDADLDRSSATRDLDYHPIGFREGIARGYVNAQPT